MHRQHVTGLSRTTLCTFLVTAVAVASGCDPSPSGVGTGEAPAPTDRVVADLQARGEQAMGVDQNTSTHVFDALPRGGRIKLQRDVEDPAGVAAIRRHLRKIGQAFASGDFSTPAFVHRREVPGTAIMAAKKDQIQYIYRDLPRGAELRFVTNDPEAVLAIHEFMAFQRAEHQAGGRRGPAHHGRAHHGSVQRDTMGQEPAPEFRDLAERDQSR